MALSIFPNKKADISIDILEKITIQYTSND